MTHMYRVMQNDLKNGTAVLQDRIPTEKEATKLAAKMRRLHKDSNFFTQEYEESRTWSE